MTMNRRVMIRNRKIWLIVASVMFLLFGLLYFWYSAYVIEEVFIVPADIYIDEGAVGFNLDKDLLHFGKVKPGTSSSLRFLELENKRDYPITLVVIGAGDLKGVIYSSLKDDPSKKGPFFLLSAQQTATIAIQAIAPPGAKEGDKFFGEIKIIFKR